MSNRLLPRKFFCLLLVFACGFTLAAQSSTTGRSRTRTVTYTLTVNSNVKGGTVYLNDEVQKGGTPLEITGLAAGDYTLVVKAKGYFDYSAKINLSTDTTVTAKLVPALTMTINSNVKGASVFVDGTLQKSAAPLSIPDLKAGKYKVVVSAEGYFDYEAMVNLQKDATITARLAQKLSLTVNSNVKGAHVRFNGTTIGETAPVLINNLKAGKYEIEVLAGGYLPYKITVDLNKNTVINAILKPAVATVVFAFPKEVLNYVALPKGIKDPTSQISILIDGEKAEVVNNQFTVIAGEHTVTLVSGGLAVSKTFVFEADRQYTAAPSLLLDFK